MDLITGILEELKALKKRISRLETQDAPRWVYFSPPLTAPAWTGAAFSDTAKTLIDLSAVFGVPAYAKAVDVQVFCKDIDSTSADINGVILDATNTADQGKYFYCWGIYDFTIHPESSVVPCNADGDIYYQIYATGVLSLTMTLEIWGYYI